MLLSGSFLDMHRAAKYSNHSYAHSQLSRALGRKYMLDKHCSSMSYCVFGREFSINESMMYIMVGLNRNRHKNRLYIDGLAKIL